MKIIIDEAKKEPIYLKDILPGSCFKIHATGSIFFKSERECNNSGQFYCVNMETGELIKVSEVHDIIPLHAKLFIQ